MSQAPASFLPRYRGTKWIEAALPSDTLAWEKGKRDSIGHDRHSRVAVAEALRLSLKRAPWKWPKRPIFFITDPHADAEAFVASLVASGGIRKTGPGLNDYKLTREGKRGHFIIGGDCLDKGPSSLELLRVLHGFMDSGAKVTLLAGNHDLRLMLGIRVLQMERDPRTEHFFLRMGPKVVPLLKEIHDHYIADDAKALRGLPRERDCRRLLYPSKSWFKRFPELAVWVMSDEGVEREMERLRKKWELFAESCERHGLSMRMVYATALKCQELFLDPRGEFHWFFDRMKLAHREGSFLFVHAGFDDRLAIMLEEGGLKRLNRLYRDLIHSNPFEFYYGPVANTLRTKYRKSNMPLTKSGVERVQRMGIHAIVHGHHNRTHGQMLRLRRGMLHIECDITLDRHSRRKEGLKGPGAGVTIIRPEGKVLGISTDYPHAKLFDPQAFLNDVT
jgi:hypothetical protein